MKFELLNQEHSHNKAYTLDYLDKLIKENTDYLEHNHAQIISNRLQELIGKDTRKMLLDYNGVRGSFDIPIEKVELTDIVDGDWKDLIIKKGVVSPLH
jgi:hypothetical protein